ncbi:MAG: hypothetical protein IPK85_04550 [Gemmatimonadetes bacterium]|nr:hypothetical protein [Gemmatimonadota bacterium]
MTKAIEAYQLAGLDGDVEAYLCDFMTAVEEETTRDSLVLTGDRLSQISPRTFLHDQFHGMVLQATVQRARIYAPGAPEQAREAFRVGLRQELDRLAKCYDGRVSDDVHVRHIAALADTLSNGHRAALRDGRFRIGPAQKALNLFLKYQWTAGWIPEPPHCPFDAIIIGQLPTQVRCNWTDLDAPETYLALVAEARGVAGSYSLARWELAAYDKASPAARRANTG